MNECLFQGGRAGLFGYVAASTPAHEVTITKGFWNARDSLGRTPLHYAANRHNEIAKLLRRYAGPK